MKQTRKILSFVMALLLLVTEIQVTGLTANANTLGQETSIYDVIENEGSENETVVEESADESSSAIETETDALEEQSTVEETVSETQETTAVEENETETTVEESVEETVEIEEETLSVEETEEASVAVDAENTADESEMTTEAITSITYYMTVANSGDLTSIPFKAQDAGWNTEEQTITLNGDGDYSVKLSFDSTAGMKNLGYIDTKVNDVVTDEFKDSSLTVTITKITVNDTYDLVYETAPVLDVNSNALANIWGVAAGVKICGTSDAYLASEDVLADDSTTGKNDNVIKLYVKDENSGDESENTTEAITSIKYEVTVADRGSLTEFTWIAVGNSWEKYTSNVTLTDDDEYTIELTLNSEQGLKNLGYIDPIENSEMTVTVNKLVVNGYELTYETAPVLSTVDGSNCLANIWNSADGVKICSSDNAYLALDAGDESTEEDDVIKLYVQSQPEEIITDTASLNFVKAMGSGWNLGNSLDGFDADLNVEDGGENAWGNPDVTEDLIKAVKAKGYDSIRIPFTVHRRYTVNENAGENDYKYVINTAWLARYKEIVDWAVAEDLYVMIDIHHDSWVWLEYWDGNTSSEEYRMFTDFWKQLAAYMAEEPTDKVCFETINEPTFEATGNISAQDKLDAINRAAYEVIRGITGNEQRVIVFPTMLTDYTKGEPVYNLIKELDDEYIVATVHYYSEWVYSANLGKTGFDEVLWPNDGVDYTARDAADKMMKTINDQFVKNGIGVIVGEYGLLGYDASEGCLETGEELKYYEYMNYLASQNDGVCLVFWDNGSGIDRNDTTDYSWKKPEVGKMLEASMNGRSSYATGSDNLYFAEAVTEDVEIPLTLNGNTFSSIEGLTFGTDYTYDSTTETVTLKKEYINKQFAAMSGYGTFATLVMKFSSGADWNEYLIKYAAPVIDSAEGTKTDGIKIPVTFNGSRVRRVTAYQASGKVGPNSDWWDYLKYDSAFGVDYENGTFNLLNEFFADSTVKDGLTKVKVEFYDGQIAYFWLTIDGDKVSSNPDMAVDTDEISASEIICLYAGETEIPSQYLNMPEGGSVYGTWVEEGTTMVTLDGWPSKLIFDTKAYDNFVGGGIKLCYMDVEKYVNVSFGIKDAPVVETLEVEVAKSQKVTVNNLAEDAKLSYKISDTSIATVNADGEVTGVSEGSTVITVTVEQYNRTDDFEAAITVTAAKSDDKEDDKNDNKDDEEAVTPEEGVLPEDIPADGIPEGLWIAGIKADGYTYTGTAIKPEVRVYDGETRLKAGQDYTISYKNNTKVNDAATAKTAPTITVKGKGNYAGKETATFKITQADLGDSSVIAEDILLAYNKKIQKKVPTVTYNGKKLANKKDFTVSYPSEGNDAYKAVGEYEVVLTAKANGNFTGTKTVKLVITNSTLLSKVSVKKIQNQTYTGNTITPELTISYKGTALEQGKDYEVSYANNIEIGTATVTIKGIGNYAGAKKVTFKITGESLKKAAISGVTDKVYNGKAQTQTLAVSLNGKTLTEGTDYTLTYADNKNVGKATVTVTGKGAYTGTVKKTFKITAYDLKADSEKKIDGYETEITVKYLKGGNKPEISLTFDGTALVAGTDYTVSYKNNKAVTTSETTKMPTMTIKGKGNFTGTLTKTFSINSKALTDAQSPVTISVADVGDADRAGKYISKPVLTDADGKKLVAGKDYDKTIVYTLENGTELNSKSIVEAGKNVKVTVTGIGAYSGTIEAVYRVAENSFSKAKVTISGQEYTGKAVTLDKDDITVKIGKKELEYGTDYEIVADSYSNNVKKGTATVTVIGKGSYGGMKTAKFKIVSKDFTWFWNLFN